MKDVVDRILQTYQLMRNVDAEKIASSRQKIALYVEKIDFRRSFQRASNLRCIGLAYMKELHEGTDPRFTGC